MSLSEVEIPGVRRAAGPAPAEAARDVGRPDVIVLRAVTDARRGCVVVEGDVRCVHDREVAGEEEFEFQRRFVLPEPGYEARIEAALRPGSALANAIFAHNRST